MFLFRGRSMGPWCIPRSTWSQGRLEYCQSQARGFNLFKNVQVYFVSRIVVGTSAECQHQADESGVRRQRTSRLIYDLRRCVTRSCVLGRLRIGRRLRVVVARNSDCKGGRSQESDERLSEVHGEDLKAWSKNCSKGELNIRRIARDESDWTRECLRS
jgi:hypothetical protein